jgi:hypothetical protein
MSFSADINVTGIKDAVVQVNINAGVATGTAVFSDLNNVLRVRAITLIGTTTQSVASFGIVGNAVGITLSAPAVLGQTLLVHGYGF